MNNQTVNGVARPSARELPVIKTALTAIVCPLRHAPEIARIGLVPLVLTMAVAGIDRVIWRYDPSWLAHFWIAPVHVLIFTPFAVAMTKVAVDGPGAAAGSPLFAYGRVEQIYLLANLLLVLVLLFFPAVPMGLIMVGRQSGDQLMMTEAAMALLIVAFAEIVVFVRISFLLPAIATGRYRGIRMAWKQTAGFFERIAGIEFLAFLPFLIGHEIVRRLANPDMGMVEWLAIYLARSSVYVFFYAVTVCAPALAYRLVAVLDGGQSIEPIEPMAPR